MAVCGTFLLTYPDLLSPLSNTRYTSRRKVRRKQSEPGTVLHILGDSSMKFVKAVENYLPNFHKEKTTESVHTDREDGRVLSGVPDDARGPQVMRASRKSSFLWFSSALMMWMVAPNLFVYYKRQPQGFVRRESGLPDFGTDTKLPGATLVSYSYFEKDSIQTDNLQFFLTEAMGINSIEGEDRSVEYVLVVNGRFCTPCQRLLPSMHPVNTLQVPGVRNIVEDRNFWILNKAANVGMDIGAHNATLNLLQVAGRLWNYAYYVFLNSSVRGPFLPHYIPEGFHWTRAFTQKINDDVKAVGCSLTCLPARDLGGPGPRIESWAFALDNEGLLLAVNGGVFKVHECKVCATEGVVVNGEYALTKSIIEAGKSVSTLLYKYSPSTDWRNKEHWNCNDNVHPSRHGTYDGISMHPFESVFVKTSWHVGEPFVNKYTEWRLKQRLGQSTTAGRYNERKYFYAISPDAQKLNPLLEKAYKIPQA